MLKTLVICDFCERPLPEDENKNIYLHRTEQFNTSRLFPHMCESCANKIDSILIDFKLDMAHKAGLASKFAQINEERKVQWGTEG